MTETRAPYEFPIVELTRDLSALELHCPFCGECNYSWEFVDPIRICPHLISVTPDRHTLDALPVVLGDAVLAVFGSGPKPESLYFVFRKSADGLADTPTL